MTRLAMILVSLLFSCSAWCGELTLLSNQVYNGEVAVLRWQGEPLSFGVVRFNDDFFYLYSDPEGAVALLPVSLDFLASEYPLSAALVDLHGRTTTAELMLRVEHKKRPIEHLSLPERMVTPVQKDVERIKREADLLNSKYETKSPRLWSSFERPVHDPVSSVFGKRRLMNGKPKSPHSGTDFRSPEGTLVHSISNGRVVLTADLFLSLIHI